MQRRTLLKLGAASAAVLDYALTDFVLGGARRAMAGPKNWASRGRTGCTGNSTTCRFTLAPSSRPALAPSPNPQLSMYGTVNHLAQGMVMRLTQ